MYPQTNESDSGCRQIKQINKLEADTQEDILKRTDIKKGQRALDHVLPFLRRAFFEMYSY